MTKTTAYGASPGDWDVFDLILGLGKDLLPVVAHPEAKVAPTSKLKELGKVPSVFNQQRQVIGLAKWTERITTDQDIAKWSREISYGICLQTREARGIDVDVADRDKAARIKASIERYLGYKLPCRCRANSGKFLLLVRVVGEIPKSTVAVDGGLIEFLGTGQQCIVSSTHPSGTRYELQWPEQSPSIPTLSGEEYQALKDYIHSEFGVAPPVVGSARRRGGEPGSAALIKQDATALHLINNNHVIGEGRNGELYIECPWKYPSGEAPGHSCDSGETETVFFPAGTNGYEQGHFKCVHANCLGRSDEEFKSAFQCGTLDDFEVLPPLEVHAGGREAGHGGQGNITPALRRSVKRGGGQATILPTIGNVLVACRRPEICRWHIALDMFTDAIVWAPRGTDEWREFKDADYVALREWLEQGTCGFDPIGRELIRDVVMKVADENRIDIAQIWLKKQVWDRVSRTEMFLTTYLGVEDTPYARAVSRYIWTALAGRILQPGVKADMVPILVGEQGIMKSTAVAAMSPHSDWFTEVKLDDRDDNLSRQLRGKVVVEMPELSGLHTRELEAIKAWITKTFENWVPKYREFATKFWRRCLFIGTTNMVEFLTDKTGNRRWLPAICLKIDIEALKRDRDQLWAEGAEDFKDWGVDWSVEKLSAEVHEKHTMGDAWQDMISVWLERTDSADIRDTEGEKKTSTTVHQILVDCLNFNKGAFNMGHEKRVGAILRKLGWKPIRPLENGKKVTIWVKK